VAAYFLPPLLIGGRGERSLPPILVPATRLRPTATLPRARARTSVRTLRRSQAQPRQNNSVSVKDSGEAESVGASSGPVILGATTTSAEVTEGGAAADLGNKSVAGSDSAVSNADKSHRGAVVSHSKNGVPAPNVVPSGTQVIRATSSSRCAGISGNRAGYKSDHKRCNSCPDLFRLCSRRFRPLVRRSPTSSPLFRRCSPRSARWARRSHKYRLT
jgi:hypothetical protein